MFAPNHPPALRHYRESGIFDRAAATAHIQSLLDRNALFPVGRPARSAQLRAAQGIQSLVMDTSRDRGYLRLPTGSGKTALIGSILNALQGVPAVFLVHRENLIEQTVKEFRTFAPDVRAAEFYGRRKTIGAPHDVVVTTYQSLAAFVREARTLGLRYPLVIPDECHMSYKQYAQRHLALIPGRELVVALSATPRYTATLGAEEFYGKPVYSMSLREGILEGCCAGMRAILFRTNLDFSPSKTRTDEGDLHEHDLLSLNTEVRNQAALQLVLSDALRGLSKVASCLTIDQTIMFEREARARGHACAAIHSRLSLPEQKKILTEYDNGTIETLFFVDKLTAGWNCPRASVLINVRPTCSLVFAEQRMGRIGRLFEGKQFGIIIDLVDGRVDAKERPPYVLACQILEHQAIVPNPNTDAGRVLARATEERVRTLRGDALLGMEVIIEPERIVEVTRQHSAAQEEVLAAAQTTATPPVDYGHLVGEMRRQVRHGLLEAGYPTIMSLRPYPPPKVLRSVKITYLGQPTNVWRCLKQYAQLCTLQQRGHARIRNISSREAVDLLGDIYGPGTRDDFLSEVVRRLSPGTLATVATSPAERSIEVKANIRSSADPEHSPIALPSKLSSICLFSMPIDALIAAAQRLDPEIRVPTKGEVISSDSLQRLMELSNNGNHPRIVQARARYLVRTALASPKPTIPEHELPPSQEELRDKTVSLAGYPIAGKALVTTQIPYPQVLEALGYSKLQISVAELRERSSALGQNQPHLWHALLDGNLSNLCQGFRAAAREAGADLAKAVLQSSFFVGTRSYTGAELATILRLTSPHALADVIILISAKRYEAVCTELLSHQGPSTWFQERPALTRLYQSDEPLNDPRELAAALKITNTFDQVSLATSAVAALAACPALTHPMLGELLLPFLLNGGTITPPPAGLSMRLLPLREDAGLLAVPVTPDGTRVSVLGGAIHVAPLRFGIQRGYLLSGQITPNTLPKKFGNDLAELLGLACEDTALSDRFIVLTTELTEQLGGKRPCDDLFQPHLNRILWVDRNELSSLPQVCDTLQIPPPLLADALTRQAYFRSCQTEVHTIMTRLRHARLAEALMHPRLSGVVCAGGLAEYLQEQQFDSDWSTTLNSQRLAAIEAITLEPAPHPLAIVNAWIEHTDTNALKQRANWASLERLPELRKRLRAFTELWLDADPAVRQVAIPCFDILISQEWKGLSNEALDKLNASFQEFSASLQITKIQQNALAGAVVMTPDSKLAKSGPLFGSDGALLLWRNRTPGQSIDTYHGDPRCRWITDATPVTIARSTEPESYEGARCCSTCWTPKPDSMAKLITTYLSTRATRTPEDPLTLPQRLRARQGA